jgi:TonB-dependent Receptor Plug Domain
VTVTDAPPMIRTDAAELGATLDAHSLESQPLPTRNFLQLLTLAPGVSAPLTNNSAIGRNSPNVSVNGSRVTQNGYLINGIDATDISLHVFADVAVPAPESISEVNVQTSLFDASVSGAGGSVQLVTKSGTNVVHGSAYEYFRNEAFNANDANLNAVGLGRPEMRRNVYGATLGGPLRKNRAFFFVSYQGTREANGATDQSLYKSVLIASGLTNDRSAATLMNEFGVPSIDPISLKLLNFKLPNGNFLIPTPQTADGLVTGTVLSTYHEEQFNTNLDYRVCSRDLIAGKFFFAHSPLFSAISGSNFDMPSSLPGFGTFINVDNRVLSMQETHTFSPNAVNEARLGYSFLRHDEVPQESVLDSSIGIQRSNAGQYPGLPLIRLGVDGGGASIGTSDITYRGNIPSLSFADILSLQRGKQNIRLGGEIRHLEWRARSGIFSYGEIDFPTFNDFLIGNTGLSQFDGNPGFADLGTGLTQRDSLTTDYHLFVQDDWKISPRLTLNLDTANIWGNQLDPRTNRGISDFDRTHYFVFNYLWDIPQPGLAHRSATTRFLFSNWQLAGIFTAMSGLPADIFDPTGGLLYGLLGGRPNWSANASGRMAMSNQGVSTAGFQLNESTAQSTYHSLQAMVYRRFFQVDRQRFQSGRRRKFGWHSRPERWESFRADCSFPLLILCSGRILLQPYGFHPSGDRTRAADSKRT